MESVANRSALYEKAVTALQPDDAVRWQAVVDRIRQVEGPQKENQSGADVAQNIAREEQLSAAPEQQDPQRLADALVALGNVADWPTRPEDFAKRFEAVLEPFELQGQPITSTPALLFRYFNGTRFFRMLADSLAAVGKNGAAQSLRKRIADVEHNDPYTLWETVVDLVKSDAVWPTLVARALPLSIRRSAFVTFDAPQTRTERRSARWLHAALAMDKEPENCFIEICFAQPAGAALHFPTFVDAGWCPQFRCAAVGQPHGWTCPRDPAVPPQPEAVVERPRLDHAASPAALRVLPP